MTEYTIDDYINKADYYPERFTAPVNGYLLIL
jgi:hypothetical protein